MNKLNQYSALWGLFFVLTGVATLLLLYDVRLEVPLIINLQFSATKPEFYELLDSGVVLQTLNNHLKFEYLYIICYTALFLCAVRVYELSLNLSFKPLFYYAICFVPGIFDLIENFAILNLLDSDIGTRNFQLLFWSARLKWVSLVLFLLINQVIFFFYLFTLLGALISKSMRYLKSTA